MGWVAIKRFDGVDAKGSPRAYHPGDSISATAAANMNLAGKPGLATRSDDERPDEKPSPPGADTE